MIKEFVTDAKFHCNSDYLDMIGKYRLLCFPINYCIIEVLEFSQILVILGDKSR